MYVQEYIEKLLALAEENIQDEQIKKVVISILKNPTLSFTVVQPLVRFEESPAAPRKHHMFTGGLVVHTYSVTRIALALCDIFKEAYDIDVNRDLVVAAAILHDIFKHYQYARDNKEGGYSARDDWYLNHDYAIVAELVARGAREDLVRVVSEVHGVAPIKTYEGLIVHLADSVDARFGEHIQNHAVLLIKDLEQHTSKPYAILDEIIKMLGVKVLGFLARDKNEFIRLTKEKILATRDQKTLNIVENRNCRA